MAGQSRLIDMTGKQFGLLKVIRRGERYPNSRTAVWICACECGREVRTTGALLRAGRFRSCGNRGCRNGGKVTHGCSKGSRAYHAWMGMKARCYNPRGKAFQDYGGRGISVCQRWMIFENFLADMGEPPDGMTIDRFPNNNGNYEPGNCRWATREQQANNTRRNRVIVTSQGNLSVTQAASVAGVTYDAILLRIRNGAKGDDVIVPNKRRRRSQSST